jgi:hypothetical protein
LSSRQEIYPRGMAPLQALRQSLGALSARRNCALRDMQDRVRGRYPEAAALPGRPELDRLLEEVGAPLSWDPSAAGGAGAYRLSTLGSAQTAGTTTVFSRHATEFSAGRPTATPRWPMLPRSKTRLQAQACSKAACSC